MFVGPMRGALPSLSFPNPMTEILGGRSLVVLVRRHRVRLSEILR